MKLIDAQALLQEHCFCLSPATKDYGSEWHKASCDECLKDGGFCGLEVSGDVIWNAPTIEAEPKRGICEDCLFLDSHDDFTFACKKGKEIHDLNGACDKWRSAYLRGEAEPIEVRAAYEQKAYNKGYADGIAEKRQARWKGAGMGDYMCSLCNMVVSGNRYHYCPNCGALMDGKDGGENG